MASINFFSRLGNLWRGFISLWIADVEKNHPEIAYENAINAMVTKYTKLKSATASIIRRRDEIDARVDAERKALAAVNADLETALATNQDDLALVLLQKKSAVEAELAGLAGEAEQSKVDADDAKNALLAVKGEIGKLKAERDRMLAKMQSAQAASRSSRNSTASRWKPTCRPSTRCAITSRTPSPKPTSARNCAIPTSTCACRSCARTAATSRRRRSSRN